MGGCTEDVVEQYPFLVIYSQYTWWGKNRGRDAMGVLVVSQILASYSQFCCSVQHIN
jgi:hypothetical protein